MMSGNNSGAYELKHKGKIHRVSDFTELKKWVFQGRVSEDDSYRVAGASQWISVTKEPEFSPVFDPAKQWTVFMQSGTYKTYDFDIVVRWASEGRITDDAIIEGPRTPPGGVKAIALPALASNLRKLGVVQKVLPTLRFDGNDYPAPDTETIGKWIIESRVPVDALISFDNLNWELVSSCGLFDLEDWPRAAHGKVEEAPLPEMPQMQDSVKDDKPSLEESSFVDKELESNEDEENISKESDNNEALATYTVISGNSEMTIESVAKLKSLLKKRHIFSYDEIRHPSITEENTTVGEYLASVKSSGKGLVFWLLIVLGVLLILVSLDYFNLIKIPYVDINTWF